MAVNAPVWVERATLLPFLDPRLVRAPGLVPLDEGAWLCRDETFGAKMALRDRLVAERRAAVRSLLPEGEEAAAELLAVVLAALARDPGYDMRAQAVQRPDGVAVPTGGDPLAVLGRLVEEDFCLLQGAAGAHRLTGGILCFPARWTLAEKLGRGLEGIHGPVPFYPGALAPRVQRVFDAIRPDRPLWRANWLVYPAPDLFQPASEAVKVPRDFAVPVLWLRVERQTLSRLPVTGAVVFSIRTEVSPLAALAPGERATLADAIRALPPREFAYKGGERLMARLAEPVAMPGDSYQNP
jgi:hypothetical protein